MPRYYKTMLSGYRAARKRGSRARSFGRLLLLSAFVSCVWPASLDRSWRPIGPFGGGAEVVAVDPSDSSRIYTLTKNSFLYKSEDEGQHWRLIRFPAQQGASAHALVINPTNTKEIWIAVSSGTAATEGIYRTSDGGSSWHHLSGLKGESVFSLALYAKDTKIMAAGARDGVHLSRDGGETWTRISPLENKELQPVMSLAFDPRNDRVIYAGTPHLPWKTEDAGANWRSIHHGMIDDSDILSLIINPTEPTQLFIGACSGIYRSDNSAALWTKLLGITGAGYRTYSVAQDPKNPRVIYSGTRDGLWKSSDGGKTWHKTSPQIVKSIAISPADSKKLYFATQDSGMLRSLDGGETLEAALEGFADHRLNQLAADDHAIYVTGAQDLQAWRVPSDSMHKGQRAWHKMQFPAALQGQRLSVKTFGESAYVLGGGAIYKSADHGVNWARLSVTAAPATGMAVLDDKELIATTNKQLYRSADAGVTWKPLLQAASAQPRHDGAQPQESIARIFSSSGNRNFIVETSTGFKYFQEGGLSPAKMTMPVPGYEVNDLVLAGHAVVAATSRGMYRSTDFGATWKASTNGIDAGTVSTIAAHGSVIFTAQYGKIYRSGDAGESWNEITTEGLDETSILHLTVVPSGRLIALTPSRGVFVLEDSRHEEGAATSGGTPNQ